MDPALSTPVPVSQLRKNGFVLIQGHPCKITEMTTSKMMSFTSGREMHGNITCDSCKTYILQVRHARLDCPDYDLCESCEGGSGHGDHFEGKHVFAKIRDSRTVRVDKYRKETVNSDQGKIHLLPVQVVGMDCDPLPTVDEMIEDAEQEEKEHVLSLK